MPHDVLEDHEGGETADTAAIEGEDFAGAGSVTVLLDSEERWRRAGLLAGFGGLQIESVSYLGGRFRFFGGKNEGN